MPKQKPVWCGEHEHSSEIGAAACFRTRQGSATESAPLQIIGRANRKRFHFDDEARRKIGVAIAKAISLKNNPHLNQAQYDLVPNPEVVHGKAGPDRKHARFTYLHHGFDPDLCNFFIARLEMKVDRCLIEIELRRTTHRKKGRPPKLAERRFARRTALLCRDLLEIEPTKGRNFRFDEKSQFAKRGGFFAKILEISLVSADLGAPDEMYRLLKCAVNALPVRQIDDSGLHQRLGKHLAFRNIDKLEGLEYEAALATLTPEREQRYLAAESRPKRAVHKKPQRAVRVTSRKRTAHR